LKTTTAREVTCDAVHLLICEHRFDNIVGHRFCVPSPSSLFLCCCFSVFGRPSFNDFSIASSNCRQNTCRVHGCPRRSGSDTKFRPSAGEPDHPGAAPCETISCGETTCRFGGTVKPDQIMVKITTRQRLINRAPLRGASVLESNK
jgi:hypothetical protein